MDSSSKWKWVLPQGNLGGIVCAWMAALSGVLLAVDQGSAGAEDRADALVLFEEAVDQIVKHSYASLRKEEVIRGAGNALVEELFPPGEGAQAREVLQSQLPTTIDEFGKFLGEVQSQGPDLGEGKNPWMAMTEMSLGGLCRSIDRYSNYLSVEEVRLLKQIGKTDYVGVGVMLQRTDDNRILLDVDEGSAAEAAGMLDGDELLEIDGEAVGKKSFPVVASMMRGPRDSVVRIKVRHRFGRTEELEVKRTPIHAPPMEVNEDPSGTTIRLHHLDKDTASELRAALLKETQGASLILDLRGCQGGHLGVAVEMADYFLPKGARIGEHRTTTKEEVLESTNDAVVNPRALIVYHDGSTGSGAELMMAALAGAEFRVILQGETTYGKAATQAGIPLDGGGYLVITNGELAGPDGETWEKVGLGGDKGSGEGGKE